MHPSLCLYGLIFLNYVEGIPSLVEENCDYEVSESQNYEDFIKNYTEFISLDETRNMSGIENLTMEIEDFDESITSKETLTAGFLEEENEPQDNLLRAILDQGQTFDTSTTLSKDFSKELATSKISRQFKNSIEIAHLDKDIVKEELTQESITEMRNSDVNSEFDENIFEETAKYKDGTVTLCKLAEPDVMDGLEAIEEVERSSRAVGSGLMPSYVNPTFNNAYRYYNAVGNLECLDQNNQLCSGAPVKQRIPVKGKLRIVGKFNTFQGYMPATITANGNKEIWYRDNISTECEAQLGSVAPVRLLHSDNVHDADIKFLRQVPVTGKLTVAAKFC